MAEPKHFSLDEANALVPRLELLLGRLQQAALRLQEEVEAVARTLGRDPESLGLDTVLREQPATRALAEEIDAIVEEVHGSGVELKDIRLGLVDFRSQREGRVVYLCWQFGEPEVAFWHDLHTGFAGRQPIAGAARSRVLQ